MDLFEVLRLWFADLVASGSVSNNVVGAHKTKGMKAVKILDKYYWRGC